MALCALSLGCSPYLKAPDYNSQSIKQSICSSPTSLEQRAQEITTASYHFLRTSLDPRFKVLEPNPRTILPPCPLTEIELSIDILSQAQNYHQEMIQIISLSEQFNTEKEKYRQTYQKVGPLLEIIFNEVKSINSQHQDYLISQQLSRAPAVYFLSLLEIIKQVKDINQVLMDNNTQSIQLVLAPPSNLKHAHLVRENLEQKLKILQRILSLETSAYGLLDSVWKMHDEALREDLIKFEQAQQQGRLNQEGNDHLHAYHELHKRRILRHEEIFGD